MTRRQHCHKARLSTIALAQLLITFFALTASAAPPQLQSAVSRVTQGTTAFDIQLPLSGGTGIECRALGGIRIVLTFDQAVTAGNAAITAGNSTVNGAPTFDQNTMTVVLANTADSQAVTLTVTDVANAAAEILPTASVTFRTLQGDVNSNGTVSGADVNLVKAQVGVLTLTNSNFRCDVNGNGAITGADVNVAKFKVGTSVSGGKTENTAPTIGDIPDQSTAADTATPPIGFAVGDSLSDPATLGVTGTSSNQTLVPNLGIIIEGSGASRTVRVIPAGGQTGNAVITITVSDGLAVTVDTFVLSVGAPTKLYLAHLRPPAGLGSTGSGTSTLLLAGDEASASVRYNFTNLSSAKTGAQIRGPGDVVLFTIPAAPEADGSYNWVLTDVGAVTVAQQVEALKSGGVYFRLDTSKFPTGEIRGTYAFATGSETFTPPLDPPALPGGAPTAQDAQRFLTQATFGPTTAQITALQAQGFDSWLEQQFNTPTNSIYAEVYRRATTSAAAADELIGSRITEAWWRYAITGNDQLRQRVAFALSEIFVVSRVEEAIDVQPAGLASWHDMLANNAFGNFRKLLEDVTLHPIMGQYLNMRGNRKPVSPNFTAPNENYAREVLQLFSIGVHQLHPDGTLKLNAAGLPIDSYGQDVIEAFSHVFTGWDTDPVPVVIPTLADGNVNSSYIKPMTVRAGNHSNDAKVLLNGFTIPANASHTTVTSNNELALALDNIFFHPNVGPFISRRLIQRLVTSNPSPAYVYRVSKVFNDDGAGVRGNMKAVIKAILTDYEARSTVFLGNAGYGKLREPLLRVSHIVRAFNPVSVSGIYKIQNTDTQLGQTVYRSPTVFNFFEPDYIASGAPTSANLFTPEMQILTETTALTSANTIYSGIYASWTGGDVTLNITNEINLIDNTTEVNQLLDDLSLRMMGGQMPAAMKTRIATYVNGLPNTTTTNKRDRARALIHLVVSSSQFAHQK
jgi:uncharacterized protein (DUF1800 family)